MSEYQVYDSRVVCRNVIGGVVFSTVRLPFAGRIAYGEDDARNGYEMCLFFPNGDNCVVRWTSTESESVASHNSIVQKAYTMPEGEVEAWAREYC